MECPAHNGFVDIDIAIPDFQIETTIRIGANPCFIVNIRPLTAEIGKGHQVSSLALQAFGEIELFHEVHLPTEFESFAVYTKYRLLTRAYLTPPS